MNLAFCLYKYFPFGGLQRDFLRIAEESARRGHKIDIFTMSWEGEKDPSFSIHLIPTSGWQNHQRHQKFYQECQKRFAQKNYDAVIGFNKMPGLDIYYAADTCFQAKARQKHGAWYRLTPRYQHYVNFEHAVFSPTAKTKILLIAPQQQSFFTQFYQTPNDRFHHLPPGIDRDRIRPADALTIRKSLRLEFGCDDQHFLLLMIGSGFKTKGLDRILLGLASLPASLQNRVRLLIVGKDHPDRFQRQAKKLKINKCIQFLGGRHDVSRLLLGADLLVHPAYYENTGTVLLEALVAGLPVLTTAICGYAHYINEAKAGVVLPQPYEQIEFNQALENMLLSPQRNTWHENALVFSQNADIFSLPQRAVDIIELTRR